VQIQGCLVYAKHWQVRQIRPKPAQLAFGAQYKMVIIPSLLTYLLIYIRLRSACIAYVDSNVFAKTRTLTGFSWRRYNALSSTECINNCPSVKVRPNYHRIDVLRLCDCVYHARTPLISVSVAFLVFTPYQTILLDDKGSLLRVTTPPLGSNPRPLNCCSQNVLQLRTTLTTFSIVASDRSSYVSGRIPGRL